MTVQREDGRFVFTFILFKLLFKSVSWEYSCDEEYLEENNPDKILFSHETDQIRNFCLSLTPSQS